MSREARRGGRGARHAERLGGGPKTLPALYRRIPVYEVLNDEGLELIHDASLKILEEIGIDFRDAESLEIWREAGAEIEGERVRIPGELLMALVAKTPASFTLHARNPQHTVEIGGNHIVFAPNYGSPFVRMADDERRYGTLADLATLHKLAHVSPVLHNIGSVICEPIDSPVSRRHLHITASAIRHSDKSFMGPVTAPERAADAVEMAKIVMGGRLRRGQHGDAGAGQRQHAPGLGRDHAGRGQGLCPREPGRDPLALHARRRQHAGLDGGRRRPAQRRGARRHRLRPGRARRGAPVIYGNFLATVSMQSGAPMAGTSELALMNLMIGQLARRYDVPWRSSGMLTGSKICDAQAAYESPST